MVLYDPLDTNVRGWFEMAENQAKVAAKIAADARNGDGPYLVDLSEKAVIAVLDGCVGSLSPRTGGEMEIIRKAFRDHYGQDSQYRVVDGG